MRLLIGYDLYQKQPDKALARLNAQIDKSPKNSGFYDLLAQFQIQNKNFDQAAATAQKAIQLNPGDGEAVMLLRADCRCSADKRRTLSAPGSSG